MRSARSEGSNSSVPILKRRSLLASRRSTGLASISCQTPESEYIDEYSNVLVKFVQKKDPDGAEDGRDDEDEFWRYHKIVEKLLFQVSMNPGLWGQAAEDCESKDRRGDSGDYELVKKFLHKAVRLHDTFFETSYMTDWIAQLIYRAPVVAGVFLDMLFQKITKKKCHVRLYGWFMNPPMLTQYGKYRNVDVLTEIQMATPRSSNANGDADDETVLTAIQMASPRSSNADGDTDDETDTDDDLDVDPDDGFRVIRAEDRDNPDDRDDAMQKQMDPHVYQVTSEICVLPNIMDLDIIQALAYTTRDNVKIFAKKSVQALLYCGWEHLLAAGDKTRICLGLLELLTLLLWGLSSAPAQGDPVQWQWPDRLMDLDWNHSSRNISWLTSRNISNPENAWRTGTRQDNVYAYNSATNVPWAWNIIAAGALRRVVDRVWLFRNFLRRYREAKSQDEKGSHRQKTGYLRNIWEKKALTRCMLQDIAVWALVIKISFLKITWEPERDVMTSAQQGFMSATVLVSLLSVMTDMVQSTGSQFSLNLTAISKAVTSSQVLDFVAVVVMCFFACAMSWMVVERETPVYMVVVNLFRGLMLSDGNGLDYLKIKDVNDVQAGTLRRVFGILGVVFFCLFLCNLLIAVFSSAYESAREKARLYYHQSRAKDLRAAILGAHKIKQNQSPLTVLENCGLQHLLSGERTWWYGMLLLLLGLAMQALAHIKAVGYVGIVGIVIGSILLEAYPFMRIMTSDMKRDWYPAKKELEVHETPYRHFLRVRCRVDYDEKFFLGNT